MKVKEYIKKYDLDKTHVFDRVSFIEDLKTDFFTMAAVYKKIGIGEWNVLIKSVKQKFDGIFNKSKVNVEGAERLWNFFYASVVVPFRDEKFPDFKQSVHKHKMHNDRNYRMHQVAEEQWKEINDHFKKMHEEFFRNFTNNLKAFSLPEQIITCRRILQINDDEALSLEIIDKNFKFLAKIHHPDRGGKREKFIEIMEAKEKLEGYLDKKF